MDNATLSQWRTSTSAIALLAILCACGQSKDSEKDARAKQLDPAQAACIEDVAKRQSVQNAEFSARYTEALAARRSSVDITVAQRRANEQACLEYAHCFTVRDSALNATVVSTMFSSCLKEVERES